MRIELFYQCTLCRGNTRMTSWIPARRAVLGKTLRIREPDGWSDGWVVLTVSREPATREEIDRWRAAGIRYGHATDLQRGELV